MIRNWTLGCSVALACAGSSLALAQTTLSAETAAAIASQAAPPEPPPSGRIVQQASGGATYISGGAGAEERGAMAQRRNEFPFKVVLSAGSGEYIVAEQLRLVGASGSEPISASNVGPWVMIKAPAGSYSLEVSYKGKTQRQKVKLGSGQQQITIRFPG